MTQAILYTNRKGFPVRTHSHSGGETFHKCEKLYELGRLQGWTEKKKLASKEFGKSLEDSIREYHARGMDKAAGIADFLRRWDKVKEIPDLEYTDKEGSWEDMQTMGVEMLTLYDVRIPNLPIRNPRFQLNYNKEVFPSSHLAGIKFTAYVDMVADTPDEKILVDIKIMGGKLSEVPGIIKLDPQLRKYSWVTGIRNIAFLWFVKGRKSIKKGDTVTLLTDMSDRILAGTEVIVERVKDGQVFIIHPSFGPDDPIRSECVTKVKLQWSMAKLSDEDAKEAGEIVGKEIAEIHMTNEKGVWRKNPGIRFPDNKCLFCPMRGICLDDKTLRDELVSRKADWLDEMEDAA